MRRSLLPLLVAAFTLVETVFGSPAHSAKAIGSGVSCGAWTEARRSNNSLAYQAWIAGFLSGVNHITTIDLPTVDIFDNIDTQGIYAWVDNYCGANPLNTIGEAADALGSELLKRAAAAKGMTLPNK
jgi:hypothetical protein